VPEIGRPVIDQKGEHLKVLIIGAGAIGTYIGARLLGAGNEVVYLERPDSARLIKKIGISLSTDVSTLKFNDIKVGTTVNEVIKLGAYDLLIIAIKAFDTNTVISELKEFKNELPVILCLQNGVENEEAYIKHFGSKKVIYGSVTSAIGRIDVGKAVVEKERGVAIGTNHPMAKRVIACFNTAGLYTKGYQDEVAIKWSKMITNLLANATSAILDLLPVDIYSEDRLLKIEIRQIQESLEVMKALGIHLVDLPKAPVRFLVYALIKFPFFITQYLMIRLMGKGRGNKMPSLMIDMKKGRQVSEIDYLNGAVTRIGARIGVETPINRKLAEIFIMMQKKTPFTHIQPMRIDQFLELFE
jgi:2-dehydropantoate 2-reductase